MSIMYMQNEIGQSSRSKLTLEDLFSTSTIALELICGQLNGREIFALEMANKCLRSIMKEQYWTNLKHLTLYSPQMTKTPLNLTLTNSAWERLTVEKIELVLRRCGRTLRRLDLSTCRMMDDRRNGKMPEMFRNGPDWITNHSETALLVRRAMLRNLGSNLSSLDLSGIPLSGKLLVDISTAIGLNLRVIRLVECFHLPHSCPTVDSITQKWTFFEEDRDVSISAAQFSSFLAALPNLEELDISNNSRLMQMPFTGISKRLTVMKAFMSAIHAERLLQIITEAEQLCEFHFFIDDRTFPSQLMVDIFFAKLIRLNVLWIVFCIIQSFPMQISISNRLAQTLQSIRLSFIHGHGPVFHVEPPAVAESNKKLPPLFPSLQELFISGGGPTVAPYFLFLHKGMPNLTKLYIASQEMEELNDELLKKVAMVGRMQELTLFFCRHVSWKGFATFLDYCPHIHLLEGCEQMTDELLDKTMQTMDMRLANTDYVKQFFQFIRVQPEQLLKPEYVELERDFLLNPNSQQSESQNMHPGVIYRKDENNDKSSNGANYSWYYNFAWLKASF